MSGQTPFIREVCWQLASEQEFLLRCWEGACVSYSWPSGNTVLLTTAQGLVLRHLEQGACREAELAGLLEEAFDLPLGTAHAATSDMLDELHLLRLIENAPQ